EYQRRAADQTKEAPLQRLLLSRFATNGLRERLLRCPDDICRSKLVKPIVRQLFCVVKNDGYSRGTCCYYREYALPDFSSHSRSLTDDVNSNNPEDWHPIYRLKTMPYIQAVSRLKFLLTTMLLVGTPPVIVAAQYSYVSSGFTYLFVGSTIFSLCTLAAFSYYSTKLIGVISIHKHTGLIRIGHLTFWGRRSNTLVQLDNLIPATDYADTPEHSKTVRIGILADDDDLTGEKSGPQKIGRTFFLTRLRGEIVDRTQFSQIFGFLWQ
ncbi:Transmembrane protein 186, partial [Clonorchis sinensis]